MYYQKPRRNSDKPVKKKISTSENLPKTYGNLNYDTLLIQ